MQFSARQLRCTVLLCAVPTQTPAYDIVIRGGRVLDGNWNPWILADVAIRDGHFAKIGHVDGRGSVEAVVVAIRGK